MLLPPFMWRVHCACFNGLWGRGGLPLTGRRCARAFPGHGRARDIHAADWGGGSVAGRVGAPRGAQTKAAKEYGFLISDLERMRGRGGTALTTGIKGSGLGDLKVFAQRWLASKKKANHPLLAGTPMCDEVHEILGLPSPPQLTSI